MAVGSNVTKWKTGDRVSPNFYPDNIFGAIPPEGVPGFGAVDVQGVLSEFKVFKSHVSGPIQKNCIRGLADIKYVVVSRENP